MERQGPLLHAGYCHPCGAHLQQEKQGKPAGDHFIVEELLDFSDGKDGAGIAVSDGCVWEAVMGNCSSDSSTITAANSYTNSFCGASDSLLSDQLLFRSLSDAELSGDLCVPHGELAELEWMSTLAEESFSSEELHKQQLLSGIKTTTSQPTHLANYHFATEAEAEAFADDITAEEPFPGKARTKRARSVPCNWSSSLLPLVPTTESSSSESSNAVVTPPNPVKQPSKKERLLAALAPAVDGRRCLHCATDKTPQWRAGPMGPKTLCNACGVRYKSGRLVPEYRPAASPTFVTSEHSNSHRKVLELRRQKDIHQQQFLPVYDSGGDEFLMQHRFLAGFRPVL